MKNYSEWIEKQIELEGIKKRPKFLKGEVWRSSIGLNIGNEIDGKNRFFWRPVLVISKLSKTMLLAVPLTSQGKESVHKLPITFLDSQRYALVTQFRTLDSKRLIQKMGNLEEAEIEKVKKELMKMINL